MKEPCPPPARGCPVRDSLRRRLPQSSKLPEVGSPFGQRRMTAAHWLIERLAGRPLGSPGPQLLGRTVWLMCATYLDGRFCIHPAGASCGTVLHNVRLWIMDEIPKLSKKEGLLSRREGERPERGHVLVAERLPRQGGRRRGCPHGGRQDTSPQRGGSPSERL